MNFLKKDEVNKKYNCFKERINELKTLSADSEACECNRFVVCLYETSTMADYLFKELNISYSALEKACDTAFCKDKDFCEDECSEKCVNSAMTRLIHQSEIDTNIKYK